MDLKKITDGTSNTMMYGELSWDFGGNSAVWMIGSTSQGSAASLSGKVQNSRGVPQNTKNIRYLPNEVPFGPTDAKPNPTVLAVLTDISLGSNHPGGTHIAMCDASGHFIQDEVDLEGVWLPMASRASEEVFESPF
jgi:hypothetical protein